MAITSSHYDIAVLGDYGAGAIAAALLAAQRYRVVMFRNVNLPLAGGSPVRIRSRERIFWPDIFDAPYASHVKQELSLSHTLRTAFEHRDTSFQLVTPSLRVDVPGGLDNLPGDVARETGPLARLGDIAPLLVSQSALCDRSFAPTEAMFSAGWRSFFRLRASRKRFRLTLREGGEERQRLFDLLAEEPYGLLLRWLPQFFSLTSLNESEPLWPRVLQQTAADMLHVAKNKSLADLFIERIVKRGGQVIDQDVTLKMGKGRNGFTFDAGKSGEVSAGVCLINAPLAMTPLIWPGKKTDKFIKSFSAVAEPRYLRYALTYHLHPDGIPEGMDTLVLHSDVEHPRSPEDLLLFSMDPGRKVADNRVALDVTGHIPLEGISPEKVDAMVERMHRRVLALCPFIERHIVERYEQRLWWPEATGLELPVGNTEIIYDWTPHKDGWPVATASPRIDKGVFVAAPDLMAPLGLDAWFATGVNLFSLIKARHPLKEIG